MDHHKFIDKKDVTAHFPVEKDKERKKEREMKQLRKGEL